MDCDSAMLHAALWYAELGYPVFPCVPGGKTPLPAHGLLEATTDAERITGWWMRHPDANVAIRTDDLLAIDVDGRDNPWLADEPAQRADLEIAPQSLTPRGGRHYFFRQPEGRSWRNTAGRLAPHVDSRAHGGYVLVPPSTVGGGSYCWRDGHELTVSPARLPEPPAWLTGQLDALTAANGTVQPDTPANAIPRGHRNATLARLAGAMRRVGMSQAEIGAALRQANADRCAPPLPAREVERIAASIARYEPDGVAVALVENHWDQDRDVPVRNQPLTVRELMAAYRMLRAPVLQGLLRRGETMNVIAPPKTGKSWLVLALAMAIATGRLWLDTFETVRGDVLILDNELHPETLAHRIPQVAECLRIGMNEIAETMSVQSLRGQLRDIFSLGPYFESVAPGRFALVVLDAFYRFMPRDMDENDNGTMANIYNHLDALADRLGCAFVLIHHATKGNQSAKAVTDVGAGAGSQSRAADAHLVLRPHEEPGAVVLEAAVRSWPPVEPRVLRWSFPLWRPAPDLDPARLKSEKPKRAKADAKESSEPPAWNVERFVETFLSDQPATKAEIRARAADVPGLSWRRIADLLDIAEVRGLIHRRRVGKAHQVLYATVPPSTEQEVRS
ncbi:MAG TPA: bifunctional DNA primase/polymerase [Phycisphaerae bacterium]|nr:bifunctional DNA primase/polymerase [Phycisphaerae bacterium]HRR84754.1 bifunctional DNA primase/polymerase [Phycisphaerae bacterium]